MFRPVNRHQTILAGRLTAQSVVLLVKRLADRLKLDPTQFAGHSLRAIMAQTGHHSLTTLREYIRGGSLFLENAAATVGL